MTVPAMQPPEPQFPEWLQGEASVPFSFPEGIPGFASHRSFRLEPVGGPLHWLRSSDDHGPDFLVVEPLAFLPDYRVEPEAWMLASLGVSEPNDLVILAVVTLPSETGEVPTMNLQGPILVNPRRRIGRQVVLPDSPLGPRTPIPVEF
ncbi:MAG: flagellar assembly protein FliW [Gemmatimonadales bacterium]|nr:MAG: flagellar assembly protein FliW [Gemmatimonadales bacterium]